MMTTQTLTATAKATNNSDLSPPWQILWNQINSSVGHASDVKVEELDDSSSVYRISIVSEEHHQAVGLATILKPRFQFGNVEVEIELRDQAGDKVVPVIPESVEELSKWTAQALEGNPWLHGIESRSDMSQGPAGVFPVFLEGVIQFFNDDLSDFYGNYNEVVAKVFGEIFEDAPGGFALNPTTSPG